MIMTKPKSKGRRYNDWCSTAGDFQISHHLNSHKIKVSGMTEDQATGMLVGLAVGDALGTYLEFGPSREPDDYLRDYT